MENVEEGFISFKSWKAESLSPGSKGLLGGLREVGIVWGHGTVI